MRYRAYGKSDRGQKRPKNEDNLTLVVPSDGSCALFAVADGVGGSRHGEVASEIAVETIQAEFLANLQRFADYTLERDFELRSELSGLMSQLVEKANREIFTHADNDPKLHGMKTTTTALVVCGHGAFLGHVGDSRAYLLRRGKPYRLTEDHSWATYMAKARGLDAKELTDHPYSNILTRSVGGAPHIEVDVTYVQVEPGDRFVICSDGLTRYLTGHQLRDHSVSARTPDELVELLLRQAIGQGGADNVTVIAVEATGGDETMKTLALQQEIELLRSLFLFERLSEQEIMRLMRIMYKIRRRAGEVIIKEGEYGHELYIVAEGAVDVSLDDTHLSTIEAGGHFGELALIDNDVRAATVKAKTNVTLLTIGQEDFARILREDHQLSTKLLWSFLRVVAGNVRTLARELAARSNIPGLDAEATMIDFDPSKHFDKG